jgi:septum formation protein
MIPLDRPLVLASASPRRAELLRTLGLAYHPRPVPVAERPLPRESPEGFVLRMAREKAEAAARASDGRELILGCDTIVVLGSRILGKPKDRGEGREMLRALSGRPHLVLSGLALLLVPEIRWAVGVAETRVHFQGIPAAALEKYLDSGEYRDKAGAYALQGAAALFVHRIEGSASNVIGLPLDLLPRLLAELGLWFPEA